VGGPLSPGGDNRICACDYFIDQHFGELQPRPVWSDRDPFFGDQNARHLDGGCEAGFSAVSTLTEAPFGASSLAANTPSLLSHPGNRL